MIRKILKEFFIFFVIFLAVGGSVFYLLNGGGIAKVIRYTIFLHSPLAPKELKEGEILEIKNKISSSASGSYELIIPKINLAVPVIVPKKTNKQTILAKLEEGTVLYPGSGLPGGNGRGIILGHSAGAGWYRGKYDSVFNLINKLEIGDEFYIIDNSKKYTYRVFDKKVLLPNEANKLFQGEVVGSEIDLVTCWPLGSSSKRKIVQAKLVN